MKSIKAHVAGRTAKNAAPSQNHLDYKQVLAILKETKKQLDQYQLLLQAYIGYLADSGIPFFEDGRCPEMLDAVLIEYYQLFGRQGENITKLIARLEKHHKMNDAVLLDTIIESRLMDYCNMVEVGYRALLEKWKALPFRI